jgi:hypothetical protein
MSDAPEVPEASETPAKTTLDIVEIMAILPHRYPFLLIDRVIEMERTDAHRRDQKRDGERAALYRTLSGLPDHAGGVAGGGDGAGRRRAAADRDPQDRENKLMVFAGIRRPRSSAARWCRATSCALR